MITSYHCHTQFSDGDCSIEDHVREGIALGLDELGISDHYILYPNRTIEWSMPVDGLPEYISALQAVREMAGHQLTLRFGLEADYIPESAERLGATLGIYPFDYVIGSIHFVGDFPIDESAIYWDDLSQGQRNEIIRKYWHLTADMARSGLFDIVGHTDLYKKFGHRASVDISEDIAEALDAVADAGMAVELNTSGIRYAKEAYPAADILAQCYARGIPMLVTADAHTPANLTRYYDAGIRQLKSLGYTQQATFNGRELILADF